MYPSSVDWQPPWPRLGIMGCAASPQIATGPSLQGWVHLAMFLNRGAPSYKSRRFTSSFGGEKGKKKGERERW